MYERRYAGERYKQGVHGLAFRYDTQEKQWVNSHKTWEEVVSISFLDYERYNFMGSNSEIISGIEDRV